MPETSQRSEMREEFDAIVIGTGFAGAVTACRLVQAGLRICVLERGRSYETQDFPIYPRAFAERAEEGELGLQPDLTRLLWSAGRGVWDLRNLGDVFVAQAAGYGGGSLIYANVHLRAPHEVFESWPVEYRDLDAYYDLVAYMLDVKPIPGDLPPKTQRLEEADPDDAAQPSPTFHFFRPPLAVNFGADGGESDAQQPNRWGRMQGTCDMRGECCFGCRRGARNTLDLNYLAIAEDATDAWGDPLADVRKLAEVVSIERCAAQPPAGGKGTDGGYRVSYVDLNLERSVREPPTTSVRAPHVFLCAGAVNTTELLLRGLRQRCLRPIRKHLGARYHPNADALAVVFDCEKPHETDRGPTIGGSLLHRSGSDWLLVQDGGFPEPLEPLLGLFRSPLWAGRNRFREVDPDPGGPARGEPRRQALPFAPLPFGGVAGLLAQLDRFSSAPRASFAHALSERLYALQLDAPPEAGDGKWKVLPDQLKKALDANRPELIARFSVAAEPFVEDFLGGIAEKIEKQGYVKDLLERLPGGVIDPGKVEKLELEQQMLRLATQQLWGSQAGLVHGVVRLLQSRLFPKSDALLRQAADLLRWALDYRLGDGHTAVLLSMGRDSQPGRLRLTAQGRLEAKLPARLESRETLLQERLLRDIARRFWRGELRTNPTWSLLDRRVTVHSQGGCPMGSPHEGVTAPDGEVHGCPGLYVMDGAAFPTPIGVNPSATIAAVAEYKVETFLRRRIGEAGWRAPLFEEARRWARNGSDETRLELDPIRSLTPPPQAPPASPPIGFRFREVMEGTHGANPLPARQAHGVRDFLRGEQAGKQAKATVKTELEAKIEDLAEFLERQRRHEQQFAREARRRTRNAEAPRIPLSGRIFLAGLPSGNTPPVEAEIDPETSYLVVLTPKPHGRPHDPRSRKIEYKLCFAIGGVPWRVEGLKFFHDDPKLDVWEDSATLYFGLFERDAKDATRVGVLRLPAGRFFDTQLPSFEATGTDDPVRQAWALTAFANFFLGRLASVYVPELADAARVVARMAGRTHV